MRFQNICYRAHDPKWAMDPVSGDGAAIRGARFNPKNVPALYLATSVAGAIAEASQGFGSKIQPMTLCSYDVDCDGIVDLTDVERRLEFDIEIADMACAWATSLSEGQRPPSWTIYDRLFPAATGIVVPSFATGSTTDMRNLVLWTWGTAMPQQVSVIDPTGRLPKNQSSWMEQS